MNPVKYFCVVFGLTERRIFLLIKKSAEIWKYHTDDVLNDVTYEHAWKDVTAVYYLRLWNGDGKRKQNALGDYLNNMLNRILIPVSKIVIQKEKRRKGKIQPNNYFKCLTTELDDNIPPIVSSKFKSSNASCFSCLYFLREFQVSLFLNIENLTKTLPDQSSRTIQTVFIVLRRPVRVLGRECLSLQNT